MQENNKNQYWGFSYWGSSYWGMAYWGNISEGSIGQTNPEFNKFMGYSIRSLAEVVTCLHKAKRREYIKEQEFNAQYEASFNLMNMMIAFRKNIK